MNSWHSWLEVENKFSITLLNGKVTSVLVAAVSFVGLDGYGMERVVLMALKILV